MKSVNGKMSLSRWLASGSPSIFASWVLAVTVLHSGFKIPWGKVWAPSAVFMATYTLFCAGMYWARKQWDENRDLRLAVGLGGAYGLTAGLLGMWYAGDLGIVGSQAFANNYVLFSIALVVGTTIAVVLVSRWKPYFNSK